MNQHDSGMSYEALSYTWGSTERLAEIEVDGTMMLVTANLYLAYASKTRTGSCGLMLYALTKTTCKNGDIRFNI